MAQLKITFQATTGNQPSNGPNWNASKEQRFINWVWAMYAPKDTIPGSPTFGQLLPRNLANETIAFQNYADGIYNGTKANIRAWEKSEVDKASVVADMD